MTPCEGPLVWFDAGEPGQAGHGAILECARPECGYVVITGAWNDEAHSAAPVLREGVG